MDLPKFDGDYYKWENFSDIFLAFIHNNKSKDNNRKLNYLISSFRVMAKLIKAITVTNDNYKLV